ncbi:MAG: NAD-dependent epimerase/dehydratase family protein [Bergeyella zoohelcum]|nr:NAD-dependent epimerase/dehydratase family protein [Bergeyella zoohelcum]
MVLVTGATGILGRLIVLELLKRGRKVRATHRPNSNLEEVRKSFRFYTETPDVFFQKIEWVEVDFSDLDSLQQALQGVEEVYHTAGKVSFNPKDRKELFKTNISNTKRLLYACEETQVKKFCHISSIAVLDGLNEKGEMDEDSDFNPKFNHSDYALSKHYSEMEVWRASAEGLPVVVLNPGVIIGSGNWEQSSGEIFSTMERNAYTFKGASSYVDVRDVAEIAIRLMEENAFGERFVIVSETIDYKEVAIQIRRKLNRSMPKLIPDFLLKLGLLLSFLLGWLFPSLRIINRLNISTLNTKTKVSADKIKKRLGYSFIPIRESIDFHLNNYIKDKKQ